MAWSLAQLAKSAVRWGARKIGVEVRALRSSPLYTLCGLRRLGVRTVLDVGANAGQFARQALRWFPEADIVSFEPLSEAVEELRRLAQRCRGRLRVEQVALGDRDGTLSLKVHAEYLPSSSLLEVTARGLELYPFQKKQVEREVRVVRLDEYLVERGIELRPPVVVKLDVQGYEWREDVGSGSRLYSGGKPGALVPGATDLPRAFGIT